MKITLFLLMLISSIYADNDMLVEINTLLKEHSHYKIIDARDADSYASEHIMNALNFPVVLTYENRKVNGKIIAPYKMQNIVRKLGLETEDKIVIYDDGSFFDEARLFWVFEVYGFKNVQLSNGGYDYLVSPEKPVSIQTDHFYIHNISVIPKLTAIMEHVFYAPASQLSIVLP